MPIYEYRCRDCGEALEVRQAFTDEALTECPNCTGSLRKIFSTPGISFKGSGFDDDLECLQLFGGKVHDDRPSLAAPHDQPAAAGEELQCGGIRMHILKQVRRRGEGGVPAQVDFDRRGVPAQMVGRRIH